MSKKSERIVIQSNDIETLERLSSGSDEKIALRARIILACQDENENKKIAQTLHTTEVTVRKWKEAYRLNGISGIGHVRGGGRPAKKDIETVYEDLMSFVKESDSEWTLKSLSDRFGVSEYQVSQLLHSEGIQLNRIRQWTYTVKENYVQTNSAIVGFLLSYTNNSILTVVNRSGLLLGNGTFRIRNNILIEDLTSSKTHVKTSDVIEQARNRAYIKNHVSDISQDRLITDIIDEYNDDHENIYYVFSWGKDPFTYLGKKLSQVICKHMDAAEDVLSEVLALIGGTSSAKQHQEAEELCNAISHFVGSCDSSTAPIDWSRQILGAGTQKDPVKIELDTTESFSSPEEFIESIFGKESLSADQIQGMLIGIAKDSNGYTYKPISTKGSFPNASSFEMTTKEGIVKGFNQLEEALLVLMEKAGKEMTDLFIENVKKNSGRSE